ncbi:ribonuclease HI [Hyphobacterium sp. CCMP332]|nr:ribonuclease HI [Hyphobacterium sp. CCMP332]
MGKEKVIEIFTDGASSGNPGPGGFGIVLRFGDKVKEHSEGFQKTTNNRMELLAVIRALEMLKRNDLPVHIYSDSKYVIDAITKGWVFGWQKKNFKGKKNPDLWMKYLKLHPMFKLKYFWVKGHAGHPENERCDELAVRASQGEGLMKDVGYEGN